MATIQQMTDLIEAVEPNFKWSHPMTVIVFSIVGNIAPVKVIKQETENPEQLKEAITNHFNVFLEWLNDQTKNRPFEEQNARITAIEGNDQSPQNVSFYFK